MAERRPRPPAPPPGAGSPPPTAGSRIRRARGAADGARRLPARRRRRENVLVYDYAARPRPQPTRGARVQAELARALPTGPASWCSPARSPTSTSSIARPRSSTTSCEQRRQASPATISPSPARTTGSGTRWRSRAARPPDVRGLLRQRHARPRLGAWLGPGYQVTSQVNVVNPGGQAQVAHRDYHLGFMTEAQAPRTPPTCTGCRRPSPCRARSPTATCPSRPARRSTCRTRSSTARLPGVPSGRVRRVLRGAPRAAAARQGRRGVLQPGPVPRRRHQPVRRRAPDGESAAGLLGLRPGDGERRPGGDVAGVLPGAGAPPRRRGPRRRCATSSPPPRRATPSRPTSTWTSRSTGWPRRPRPTCSGRPSTRGGRPSGSSRPW